MDKNVKKLLADQEVRVKNFIAFKTNYGKANRFEKAKVSYHEKRLKLLNEWWVDFDKVNTELTPYADNEHEYFVEKDFETYSEKYKQLRTTIQNAVMKLKGELESDSASTSKANVSNGNVIGNGINDDESESEELGNCLELSDEESADEAEPIVAENVRNVPEVQVLMYQREEFVRAVKTIEKKKDVTVGMASMQIDNLKTLWSELRAAYRQIAISEHKDVCKAIDYGKLQDLHMTVCGNLNDIVNGKKRAAPIKLPEVKLPEFSGKITEWKAFKDLFEKMVHTNEAVPDAIKVQYLKSCLKGEAAKLVKRIEPNEKNYNTCYEILINRYENKREVFSKLCDEILDLPLQRSESSAGLKQMHDTVYESIMAIQNIGESTKNWDKLLVQILMKKLDSKTIMDYEQNLDDVKELKSLKFFLNYLEKRFLMLSAVESKMNVNQEKKFEVKKDESFKCTYCEKPHSVYKCEAFRKLDASGRFEWVKGNGICFHCLQIHKKNECRAKYPCKICDKKHNTLVHLEPKKKGEAKSALHTTTNVNENNGESSEIGHVNALITSKANSVLLATAIVRVVTRNGGKIRLRALIDPGSQSSFITENAVQLLRVPRLNVSGTVSGIGNEITQIKHSVMITAYSRWNDDYHLTTEAVVLPKITGYGTVASELAEYDHLANLRMADTESEHVEPIDLLLGVVEYTKILKPGLIKGADGEPLAQNSEFGWLIMGAVGTSTERVSLNVTSLVSNADLDKKLAMYFADTDIIESDDEDMTAEEKMCEEFYKKTTTRDENGRFIVKMPYKDGEPVLGDSKKAALATLFSVEKKFTKLPEIKKMYTEAIHDAIRRGHMELVTIEPKNAHFIPHHAVLKDSSTTKLRIVHNASQKTSNGRSLNEQLAMGKLEQSTILTLIMRSRQYKIAMVADIEKMYKQIKLHESQQHLQMMLWRDSSREEIKMYKMTTVMFGLGPSPFLAIRTLKELASSVENEYPLAAMALRDCFYVDDYSDGADSVEQALEKYDQIKAALTSAGFNLRKFVSNSSEFLQRLPETDRENIENGIIKTLGIGWDPINDVFSYKFNLPTRTNATTRRQILSEIASVYDPVGWIVPVIIKARILMQSIWQYSAKDKKVTWDSELPEHFVNMWKKIKAELYLLLDIKIPRWLRVKIDDRVQLYGYCDASKLAYAACVYLVYIEENGIVHTELLMARARVAPVKQLTTPKLELCAAVLLTKVVKKVIKSMNLKFEAVHLFSDSRIVLDWINTDPKRYKSFVATRLTKINNLKNVNWSHINGIDNPADCASRGILPRELLEHELWWNAKRSMGANISDEHDEHEIDDLSETNEEWDMVSMTVAKNKWFLPDVSSIQKLQRIMVYVLRFVKLCKKEKISGDISVNELRDATTTIIKCVQRQHFSNEISLLTDKKELDKKNALKKLNVFLDYDNVLRVGGRLKNAQCAFDNKHQIVMPKDSKITVLLVRDHHRNGLHSGPKLTETLLRKKFWIIDGKRVVKKVVRECMKCAKIEPHTMQQLMGDLPEKRVNQPRKVFFDSAVDYAGPISIKTSTLRNSKIVKGYIAVFVCMATKAIHLEAVGDLTAEKFLAALRRFVARRGEIRSIQSDNGTNFVKANKILNDLTANEKERFQKTMEREMLNREIQWHFIPPRSPHMNGLAEAAVKTMKFHLKRVMGATALTFEELATLLCQIEAVVNSRPLCELPNGPDENDILTPAHFLNVAPSCDIPDDDWSETKSTYLKRWQLVQRMAQQFWRKWKDEYLNELQVRKKWISKQPELQLGDVVMIKEDNDIATKWSMGRVVEKFPGEDGHTRVVKLKTNNGEKTRAITKLAPLPINDTNDIISTTSQIARVEHRSKRGGIRQLWSPKIVPMVAMLLVTFSQPVSGETNAYDIAREAIRGAATMFKSETANTIALNWKRLAPVQQSNLVNELANDGLKQRDINKYIEQSVHTVEEKSKSTRVAWIFFTIVMCVSAIGWLCYAGWAVCGNEIEELGTVTRHEVAPIPRPRRAAPENVTVVTIK